MTHYKQNAFLQELLSLQQDGSGAISAPSNWSDPPLIEVPTSLNARIDQIAKNLVSRSGANETGAWWFLVGSPGNGKSAAVGRLVRTLRDEEGAVFRLEKEASGGKGKEISQLSPQEIPYKVELYENDAPFASAWFAQDASVVPNPFEENADPAKELIDLLRGAEEKGVSLVVCANRGVLEKAHEISSRNKQHKKSSWFRALRAASQGERLQELAIRARGKAVFKTVTVEVTALDAQSLLLEGVFTKLIREATSEDKWAECADCAAKDLCPFKQNRDWLFNPAGSERLNSTLQFVEYSSGQIVVFREAVALVSLLLAGCSRDYSNEAPCSWVRRQIERNAFFSLLSRRIYLSLFSSFSPFGLEATDGDRSHQLEKITELAQPPRCSETTCTAIQRLTDEEHHVSPDVGLARLIGKNGVLTSLDPIREGQGQELEQHWDLAPEQYAGVEHPLVSELEKKCFGIWKNLEDGLDNYGPQTVPTYRLLRRWITSVTFRLGFYSDGKLLFENELRQFGEILDSSQGERSTQQVIHLRRIAEQVSRILAISEEGIEISPFVSITGRWVGKKMEVQIVGDSEGTRGLVADVGGKEFAISGNVYAWLNRKQKTGLSEKTFPNEILQIAEDIRRRAASDSGYAFSTDDVRLRISLPRKGKFLELLRIENSSLVERI